MRTDSPQRYNPTLATSCLLAVASLLLAVSVSAHSVHQREMSIFLANETIQLLQDRATGVLPGGPGLRSGDIVHVLFQSTPVANAATQGAGAYMTLYIPAGLEVVDAAMVNWARIPRYIFESSSPNEPGPMYDGWGSQGRKAPVGFEGSLAAVYGDTGIFFSTDPRTVFTGPVIPNPSPSATGQLLGIMNQSSPYLYNQWDLNMTQGYNGNLPGMNGRGHTAYGYGSVVAGPQTHYKNDYVLCGSAYCPNTDTSGAVGPWRRIRYGGSRTATGGVTPWLGDVTRVSAPTASGVTLNPTNPLSGTTNAVRFALGERVFGVVETVRVSLRVADISRLDGNGCFEMNGDVFGGDASGWQDGKDHAWRYAVPGTGNFNSCMYLFKDGPLVAARGTTVTYTINYKNVAARTLNSVVIRDLIDSGLVTYLSSSPAPSTIVGSTLTWNLGALAQGAGGSIQVTVRINNNASNFTINTAEMSSTEYPTPFRSKWVTRFDAMPNVHGFKSVSPSGARPGDQVTYRITLENRGNGPTLPGGQITVDDVLPAGFNYVAGSGLITAGPSCPFNAVSDRQWKPRPINGLCPGDTMTITFRAQVGGAVAPGVYLNDISFVTKDPAGIRDTTATIVDLAPVSVSQPAFHDLTISASDSDGGEILPGDKLCYNISLPNTAPIANATNVVLVVPMPAQASLEVATVAGDGAVVAYSAMGSGGPWTYAPVGPYDSAVTHLRFSWPVVNAGEVRNPAFCVRINQALEDNTELVLQGQVTSTESGSWVFPSDDPTTSATDDPTGVFVRAFPALATSVKSVSSTCALPGEPLTFTITVTDSGTSSVGATNVVIADVVNTAKLTNISLLTPLPNGVAGGNVPPLTWTIQSLPLAGSVDLQFTADVRDPFPGGSGTILNTAQMMADQQPFATATNTVSVQVGRPSFASSSKQAVPTTAREGATVNYVVRLREAGTFCRSITSVTVVDTIDTVRLDNVVCGPIPPSPTGILCSYTAPILRWIIPVLTPGQDVDLPYSARVIVGASGTINNVASIVAAEQATPTVTPNAPVSILAISCGDTVIDVNEECDDGGETATCDADCTLPSCGDNTVNTTAGEQCDDGGETATCNANCTLATCGDGILNVTAGEECDDAGESATCDVDCTLATCGDSMTNTTLGEECDDGGESDTCNADCTLAMCGDGILNQTAGEQCDDGMETGNCDLDCTFAACGDGNWNPSNGEQCDDAGESPVCDVDCTLATCGDGTWNPSSGEQCDDGQETATCDANCTLAACGDGTWNPTAGEECDDGGKTANCDDDCTLPVCGDGRVNPDAGEDCDDGMETASCDADCTAPICGDMTVNPSAGEACDDGMETPTCNADCTLAMCGDLVVNPSAGEECDDGGESPVCNADCTLAMCGDGNLNPSAGEQCDDANTDDGDGCTATCLICLASNMPTVALLKGIKTSATGIDFTWMAAAGVADYHLNSVTLKVSLLDPKRSGLGVATCDATGVANCTEPDSPTAGLRFYQVLAICDPLTEGPF